MEKELTQYNLGYWPQMKQAGIKITAHIPEFSTNIDLKVIDDWLKNHLEIDVLPYSIQMDDGPDINYVQQVIWRILHISRHLQQYARIPIFDTGTILNCNRSKNQTKQWTIEIRTPSVDHLPVQVIEIVLNASINIMFWIINNHQTLKDPIELFKTIETNALNKIRGVIQSGISTIPILHAAYQHNIPIRHIGAGVYQLGLGSKRRLIDRSSVDLDSLIGCTLAANKKNTAQVLHSAGFPAPIHIAVNNEQEARQAASKLGYPLVIKPADRERGEGVSVDITNIEQLLVGYKIAAKASKLILVERQVPGICYRLLVANGKLLYAIRRGPRSIQGDGKHTVLQLIQNANLKNNVKPKWLQSKAYPIDQLAIECMSLAGFTPNSIPKQDEWVPLRKIESTQWGGHIEDVTHLVHPDNRALVERVTEQFDLSNAGIDMITTDIATPWHQSEAIINEVNSSPYFGGNDTAKAAMPTYLSGLIDGKGRIPIDVILGTDSIEEALKHQKEYLNKGINCYVTSHKLTIQPNGQEVIFTSNSLFNRSIALLMDKNVEALIMIIETDELLYTGLPIDKVNRLFNTHTPIFKFKNKSCEVDELVKIELTKMLELALLC